jgi:DNA polymerase-3 subunit delta
VPLDKAKTIINEIKSGNYKPIYFLMGEEPYYIDGIAKFIENTVLTEEEKGFNQMVLYGRDVSIDDIISNAKRYPMMADKQVVIVKEAQELSRTIENLVSYVENPQPTTILVICYKYKTLDKRKKLAKIIDKSGVLFESKKLYENQVPDWIRRVLASRGYTITPKASQMLVEFLGNDLSKVNNELEKLQLIIQPGAQITPQVIEENIGISKDFNNFELQNAIGAKDIKKAFVIIQCQVDGHVEVSERKSGAAGDHHGRRGVAALFSDAHVRADAELEPTGKPVACEPREREVELVLLDPADQHDPLHERLIAAGRGDDLRLELPAELAHDGLLADCLAELSDVSGECRKAEPRSRQLLPRHAAGAHVFGVRIGLRRGRRVSDGGEQGSQRERVHDASHGRVSWSCGGEVEHARNVHRGEPTPRYVTGRRGASE